MSQIITPATYQDDGQDLLSYLDIDPEMSLESGAKVVESRPQNVLHFTQREPAFELESASGGESESSKMRTLANQIVVLQSEGKQKPEIMRQVWGVTPGASDDYRAAQEEYKLVMRYIAEQLGA
jgi:hypothetical protein